MQPERLSTAQGGLKILGTKLTRHLKNIYMAYIVYLEAGFQNGGVMEEISAFG